MIVVTLLQEAQVAGFRKIGFIVQQMKDSHGFFAQDVQNRLIVKEANGRPLNFLLGILRLFAFEDDLVDVVLQAFISIVDTELFETILRKVFKTKKV